MGMTTVQPAMKRVVQFLWDCLSHYSVLALTRMAPTLHHISEVSCPFPPLTKGESKPIPTQGTARKHLLKNTHMAG